MLFLTHQVYPLKTIIPVLPCKTDKCFITQNLSAMQTKDMQTEIAALEIQLKHLNNLLDQSFRNNEILAKTKVIYHDVRLLTEKVQQLKEMAEAEGK